MMGDPRDFSQWWFQRKPSSSGEFMRRYGEPGVHSEGIEERTKQYEQEDGNSIFEIRWHRYLHVFRSLDLASFHEISVSSLDQGVSTVSDHVCVQVHPHLNAYL